MVSGNILSIDQGNRTRRNVVGFGVGESKVTAKVNVYIQAPGEAPRLLQSFNADSESGKKPGLAVAGVGAAAGSAATAAADGVGGAWRRSPRRDGRGRCRAHGQRDRGLAQDPLIGSGLGGGGALSAGHTA